MYPCAGFVRKIFFSASLTAYTLSNKHVNCAGKNKRNGKKYFNVFTKTRLFHWIKIFNRYRISLARLILPRK